MKRIRRYLYLMLATALCCRGVLASESAFAESVKRNKKPRVIVTIDGEGDDQCSMVRFLMYANEWDLQGIVFSSSKHHWKGDGKMEGYKWLGTEWLDEQLDAYAEVYPNLKLHDSEYPSPEYIKSRVYIGNIFLEGDMKEATLGSDHIAEILLKPDTSPVWLQAWGGPNTIARALKTIQEKHPERMTEVVKKARIYMIAEQDVTHKEYIRKEWPDIMTLWSSYDAYGGISYRWYNFQSPEVLPYFEPNWLYPNIVQGHGALGALYLMKKGKYRSEGDSPSFLHLINTGLRSSENPTWGGWGGRFIPYEDALWKSSDKEGVKPHSILRWAKDFQNDWAARADWCVADFDEANHPPVVQLTHSLDLLGKPGQRLPLDASNTSDPDGDKLRIHWWQHIEAGKYSTKVKINSADQSQCVVDLPSNASPGDTFHIICTVRDNGMPSLTRYARAIVTITE